MYHILFILSSIDEYLGWFHLLDIINNAAVDIHVHIFWHIFLSRLGWTHRSAIDGPSGTLNFLRNCFSKKLYNLISYQHCRRVPIFPRQDWHLLSFILLTNPLLGIKWYFIMGFKKLIWWLGLGCGMQTLSCIMQHLVLWPGIEPGPPALGVRNLSHWTTRGVVL